jgi:hypothetical protein
MTTADHGPDGWELQGMNRHTVPAIPGAIGSAACRQKLIDFDCIGGESLRRAIRRWCLGSERDDQRPRGRVCISRRSTWFM